MEFGQKLKEARQKAGLTQEVVAQAIGVSRQSLSNWENDRTYPDLGSVVGSADWYYVGSFDEDGEFVLVLQFVK